MNTFSVFPYFDFVCSFKVTLITTISNSLMYWLLVFPKILWRWKRKITLTASLFHMLMLTPDVLSQVSPFNSNVWTELAFESWHKAFVLYVVMFLQTCAVWRLDQFLPTAPYSPILPYFSALTISILGIWIIRQPNFHKGKFSLNAGFCI